MDINTAKDILGEPFSFMADDVAPVISKLPFSLEADILDVGTGMGYLSIILALNGFKVLTGEPEEDVSIHAKRPWQTNAGKLNLDHLITFQYFNAESMPFEDQSFDAVFFMGVLHHVEEKNKYLVLQESYRVSKSFVYFFEPNQEGVKMAQKKDPSHPEPADPGAYSQNLAWSLEFVPGALFDSYIFTKA